MSVEPTEATYEVKEAANDKTKLQSLLSEDEVSYMYIYVCMCM